MNIRGTGGSGKSYLVQKFMDKYGATPIRSGQEDGGLLAGEGKIEAYVVPFPKGQQTYVIGRYKAWRDEDGKLIKVSGGCDGISKQDEICDRVKRYAKKGNVIFESFTVTGLYSRYYKLSKSVGGMIWAYLDTPLEKSIKRISVRNGGKPFKTDNTAAKHKAGNSTRRKAAEDGEWVVQLDHKNALEGLCSLLEE